MPIFEVLLVAGALAIALWLRPWRQQGVLLLLTPMLASLVLLPWLWALPALHAAPFQLQWSAAPLVVLMLGWPLAVPVLSIAGTAAALIANLDAMHAVDLIAWLGIVPATLALALGAAIRRLLGTHPFVYVLGRGFLGSVVCLFTASALRQWSGETLPGIDSGLSMVARWLTAWGDAFVTGMLCAIFVAYRPQWLATWSDTLYLRN
jgi:uncharacterized membrane protein